MSAVQVYLSRGANNNAMYTRGPVNFMTDIPNRPRIRREGRTAYEQHWKGNGVAALFDSNFAVVPVVPKPKPMRKNYVQQNKDHIWKLCNNTRAKEVAEKAAEQAIKSPWRAKQYDGIPAKVSNNRPGSTNNKLARSESLNKLHLADVADGKDAQAPRRTSSAMAAVPPNFIKLNIASASGNAGMRRSASVSALEEAQKKEEHVKRINYGHIPKYLADRKMQWEREQMRAGARDTECPPGHTLLSKEEQRKTLDMLKATEQEIMTKVNKMPVRGDTPFLIRKSSEYERQLREIEEAIKIFSKPKVFVRNEETQ
uniref:Enkurin domain-containing protein n=1 Tax=Plectus sambesii TaxID=2011161 RepID=A0A914VXU2_9BILA